MITNLILTSFAPLDDPFNLYLRSDKKRMQDAKTIKQFTPNPPKFPIIGGIGASVKIVDKKLGDWTTLHDGLRFYYIGKIGRVVKVDEYTDKYADIADDADMCLRQTRFGIQGHSYTVRFPTTYDTNEKIGPAEICFVEEHLEEVEHTEFYDN